MVTSAEVNELIGSPKKVKVRVKYRNLYKRTFHSLELFLEGHSQKNTAEIILLVIKQRL